VGLTRAAITSARRLEHSDPAEGPATPPPAT
jgi:hypothetical protein